MRPGHFQLVHLLYRRSQHIHGISILLVVVYDYLPNFLGLLNLRMEVDYLVQKCEHAHARTAQEVFDEVRIQMRQAYPMEGEDLVKLHIHLVHRFLPL